MVLLGNQYPPRLVLQASDGYLLVVDVEGLRGSRSSTRGQSAVASSVGRWTVVAELSSAALHGSHSFSLFLTPVAVGKHSRAEYTRRIGHTHHRGGRNDATAKDALPAGLVDARPANNGRVAVSSISRSAALSAIGRVAGVDDYVVVVGADGAARLLDVQAALGCGERFCGMVLRARGSSASRLSHPQLSSSKATVVSASSACAAAHKARSENALETMPSPKEEPFADSCNTSTSSRVESNSAINEDEYIIRMDNNRGVAGGDRRVDGDKLSRGSGSVVAAAMGAPRRTLQTPVSSSGSVVGSAPRTTKAAGSVSSGTSAATSKRREIEYGSSFVSAKTDKATGRDYRDSTGVAGGGMKGAVGKGGGSRGRSNKGVRSVEFVDAATTPLFELAALTPKEKQVNTEKLRKFLKDQGKH
jgi:hypothetical protein